MFTARAAAQEIIGSGTHLLMLADVTAPNPELDRLAGQVQCVYADPPYATGNSFQRKRSLGAGEWRRSVKSLTLDSYTDRHSEADYTDLLRSVIHQAYYVLSDTGVFYLHLDWRSAAAARMICDEVFGSRMFLNEIIWSYDSGGRTRKCFSRKHDNILMYARTKNYRFDLTRVPIGTNADRSSHMRRSVDDYGRYYYSMTVNGKEYRYYEDEPIYPSDVWTDISHLQQRDPERTGFNTQKPLKLVERLLLPVVQSGDTVYDPCCGSGTTVRAAESLSCSGVTADLSEDALNITTARLEGGYRLSAPLDATSAALAGTYDAKTGIARIDSLTLPERGLSGTDAIEQIRFGRLDGDVFRCERNITRSWKYPELPLVGAIPQGSGEPAVSVTDAFGCRHLFIWEDEEA